MISLVSIVLNEEELIGAFIDENINLVNEIVIVDGGSTDNTVDIIRSRGIEPFFNEWNHDFSTQRNFAIEMAKNDWCLTLDPDERLKGPDVKAVINELVKTSYPAFRAYRTNYIDGEFKGDGDSQFRFVRKSSGIRYVGKIHEEMRNPDGSYPNAPLINRDKLYILHEKTLKRAYVRWQYYKHQFGSGI